MIDKERLSELALKIQALDAEIEGLIKFANENFLPKINEIQKYFKEVKLLCNNLNHISAVLRSAKAASKLGLTYKKCSEACTNHYSGLIKNFQFHDIIHQKLQHLKELNNCLTLELKEGMKDQRNPMPYTSLLREIYFFYLAQLDLIRNEYSESFEEIKRQLFKVKSEIEEVKEVAWSDSEAAFFPDEHILDLPDHLIKCEMLGIELIAIIAEINMETLFIEKIASLEERLKEIPQEMVGLNISSSMAEKSATAEELNKLFTMESERLLWHAIVCEAGLTSPLVSAKSESLEDSGIDLF